jgi:hypothetical protein
MLQKHGLTVLDVPDNIDLVETIDWINARNTQIELAVEIHINAGWGHGMETWYYHNSETSKKLAQFVNDACVAETGLPSRGVKDEYTSPPGKLGFVHDTYPLSVLTECGFIDGDNNYLSVDENLTRLAKGVARGIISYLGLKWTPELLNPSPQPVPTPVPTPPVETVESVKKEYADKLAKLRADCQSPMNNIANNLTTLNNLIKNL